MKRFNTINPVKRLTRFFVREILVNVQLITPDARGAYLERVQLDIAGAEHFVVITAFATSDGIALLEPAMRKCLEAGGQGTLVLALDRQHFNAADVFRKLGRLAEQFPNKLEVRLVRERSGLLHAKAVFAKRPDGSATLLVGSANLTERAFTHNHELGLWVNLLAQPDVSRAFQRFAQTLGGTRHEAEDLLRLAASLGDTALRVLPKDTEPRPRAPSIPWPFEAAPQPPNVPIDTFVGDWPRVGCIVGRGRRGLDVLVIRMPAEMLEHLGLIERDARKRIATATEKVLHTGYGVRLLPDDEDKRLRDLARRTSRILGKLTLNLPCFGLWMPNPHWELFEEGTAKIQAAGISAEEIRTAAQRRRDELDGPGIEREVDAIVAELQEDGVAKHGREGTLRTHLLGYFHAQLTHRTPELIARSVGFRTGRQALASNPDHDSRALARSFFVDLVQATFAATYRTGAWPRRFRSFVGRSLSARIAERCLAEGDEPNDAFALQLLDVSAQWEDDRIDFEKVTAEVNRVLGEAEDEDFASVKIEELLHAELEDDGDDD